MKTKRKTLATAAALVTLIVLGTAKFYHYNYIENTPGQAVTLRLPGLREFVCQGIEFRSGPVDHCGKRSVYKDADWGITAYYTIYGVESEEEAKSIVEFMKSARQQNSQQQIPIDVKIYSTPRSAGGSRPSKSQILHESF
jgi:hypothetical protein